MKKLALALALAVSVPAVAGSGLCLDSYLPKFGRYDTVHTARQKLFAAGFFPIAQTDPANVPHSIQASGYFEITECVDGAAYHGCYSAWLTKSGTHVLIAYPLDNTPPFLADCPAFMRD